MPTLLDFYDRQILKKLEANGRAPFAQVAQDLGISNTMVHQRVARMRELGVLRQVSIVVDEKKLGYEWGAFTGLVLREDSNSEQIIAALKKIPEVTECYYITGSYTLYVRLVAKSGEHMRQLLYDKIDHIDGVVKTESLVDFGCAFKRNVPLED